MNFNLDQIPERTARPRNSGITMVMDKGLSVRETEDFLSVAAPYLDIVKFGFGTAYVTPNLADKIKLYKEFNIPVYFGGTLLEAFLVRKQLDDFFRVLEKYQVTHVEVSDGALEIPHEEKCKLIATFSKNYTVLSEVGSKDAEIIFAPYKWIRLMKDELEAGSWKVIAEARESGMIEIGGHAEVGIGGAQFHVELGVERLFNSGGKFHRGQSKEVRPRLASLCAQISVSNRMERMTRWNWLLPGPRTTLEKYPCS